ncbi:MAG: caspase family protein [Rhizobiaceae bacterium]|nr:caspase family protein [Rhizobiaceae bacterium]
MGIGNSARTLAAILALLSGGAILTDAEARTNRALLVAVTKYPNVQGADLVGPNNDAQLVREFLTTSAPVPFAPEDVTMLADGLDGALTSPTRQAILDALDELAAKSERGDFVYLHLSGHGIQQPAADIASEPDGLDEVFLPADIKPWVDRSKGIPSAFADDEIGTAVQAIRDKGAFVWIVIDACHSGTATRALDGNVTNRKIDPDQLGIPEQAFKDAIFEAAGASTRSLGREETRALALYAKQTAGDASAAPTGGESIMPGGMVAFFAAQTVETTPELPLPRGSEDAKKLGLFTYTLFSKLAQNPAVSYRQLGQSVMQEYAAQNRTRPTPLFEGNLDTPVFGTSTGEFVQQWRVKVEPSGMTIPAGTLHRLAPGTRLALLNSPADAIEDAIGYAEVRSVQPLMAKLSTVEFAGVARINPRDIPDGAYARLAEVAFDTELVVARPAPNPTFADEVSASNQLLKDIAGNEDTPVKIRLVGPEDDADLKMAVLSEQEVALLVVDAGPGAASATLEPGSRNAISDAPRLWFLPPTAEISLMEGRRPPSIGFEGSTPDGLQREVADNLTRIFRATNLARLAAANNFDNSEFEVAFKVKPAESDELTPLEAATTPVVHPGDQVHLEAHNRSGRPVDINVLYIGSDYSIGHMYAERLHDGADVELPLLQFNDESFGVERMVVVLTEGSALTTTEDLSFLAQQGVRVMTRSAAHPEGFAGLLRDIGDAPSTRGAMKLGQAPASKGAVLIYPLENMPSE